MSKKSDKSVTKNGSGSGLSRLVGGGTPEFARAYNLDIEQMTTGEVAAAWLLIDLIGKISKDRIEELRAALLSECEKRGMVDDKGSSFLEVEGLQIKRERRKASLPPEKALRELLEQKNLPVTSCFDEVASMVLNPSKLESLVDLGKLKADDVEALKAVTWALKVKPDAKTSDELELIRGQFAKVTAKKALKG